MGTSKRDYIKRKHKAIDNSLTRSLGWVAELHDQFKPHHADYAAGYLLIAQMIEQARTSINKMKSYI